MYMEEEAREDVVAMIATANQETAMIAEVEVATLEAAVVEATGVIEVIEATGVIEAIEEISE